MIKPEERLAKLIQISTVSDTTEAGEDTAKFEQFVEVLSQLYPKIHSTLSLEKPGNRALIYKWEGTNSRLLPVLGLAHWDVVPPGELSPWKHQPFSGDIVDGVLHGRGSLDDKGMLAGWMEALEDLIAEGFKPERTIYLALGGDEETTGLRGAKTMATIFQERNIRFSFVMDEGGAVVVDQFNGFTPLPVAVIGTAEKGYLTLKLKASGTSGHASAPPAETVIGRLGRAITDLEKNLSPAKMTEAPVEMLCALGKNIRGIKGFLLRHPRFFSALILKILGKNSMTSGMIRTTVATTMINAGERENVLPNEAEAVINLRVLPGDSVAKATNRVQQIIGEDIEVVQVGDAYEPVPDAPVDGVFWTVLTENIKKIWPEAVVAPYLMMAMSDSRHYRNVTDRIYRFIPMELTTKEVAAVHGPNESVQIEKWLKMIDFMKTLLQNLDYKEIDDE